jgi:hypothetical protein
MKLKLLGCCLALITWTISFAQTDTSRSANSPNSVSASDVSKGEFLTRVEKLDTYLRLEKMDMAKVEFDEIQNTMSTVVGNIARKVRAANISNNEALAKEYLEIMNGQRGLFAQVLQLKGDLIFNRKSIHEKLEIFSTKGFDL